MNNKMMMWMAAALTALFLVLNFTMEDSGTLYLILAVVSGLATVYFASSSRKKS